MRPLQNPSFNLPISNIFHTFLVWHKRYLLQFLLIYSSTKELLNEPSCLKQIPLTEFSIAENTSNQIGVKVGVGVGMLSHINKQLAGINHIALSGNGVGHYLTGHILVSHFGIMHLVVAALDILAKVLANKSVEKRT